MKKYVILTGLLPKQEGKANNLSPQFPKEGFSPEASQQSAFSEIFHRLLYTTKVLKKVNYATFLGKFT